MIKLAIWTVVESKPGKEREVEEFLKSAQAPASFKKFAKEEYKKEKQHGARNASKRDIPENAARRSTH